MAYGNRPHAAELLAAIPSARRQRDARRLLDLFTRVTNFTRQVWHGSIIGFGSYHYEYPSGRQGDAPAAGFAPRKSATVIYLPDGIGAHRDALKELGPHKTGVGCLYVTDLDAIDVDVLAGIIGTSFTTVTTGTYRHRARDSGQGPGR